MHFSDFSYLLNEDVNKDAQIDLKDAILAAKQLSSSANFPDKFTAEFKNFCSTVQIVAGSKSLIKKVKSTDNSPPQIETGLPSEKFVVHFQQRRFDLIGHQAFYADYFLIPPSPPPII